MVVYTSIEKYIECGTDLIDRINRLGLIITLMENSLINAAIPEDATTAKGVGHIEEYSLDDGQTKIRTKYRDLDAMAATIDKFDLIRQKLIARLNNNSAGRVFRLVDGKNFTRCV